MAHMSSLSRSSGGRRSTALARESRLAARWPAGTLVLAGIVVVACGDISGTDPPDAASVVVEPTASEPSPRSAQVPPEASPRATPGAPDVAAVDELDGTHESLFALGDAVLEAIAADDPDRLESLALSEPEFVHIVWPELPSSRPERGVPVDYAWGDLYLKSKDSILSTLRRHGGKRYSLMRIDFEGETTEYRSFRVHRDARLQVQDDTGQLLRLDLFGSVIERRGRYKAFSMFVD